MDFYMFLLSLSLSLSAARFSISAAKFTTTNTCVFKEGKRGTCLEPPWLSMMTSSEGLHFSLTLGPQP